MKIKDKTHLQSVIKELMDTHGHNVSLNHLDVSAVTDMSKLFFDSPFNGAIDQWNVSNVESMSFMFNNANAFNQPIGTWDVSKVKDMRCMFNNANAFNQPIGNWNVSNVKDMRCMFYNASAFFHVESFLNWNVSTSCETENFYQEKTFQRLLPEVENKALCEVLPPEQTGQRSARKAL